MPSSKPSGGKVATRRQALLVRAASQTPPFWPLHLFPERYRGLFQRLGWAPTPKHLSDRKAGILRNHNRYT